MNLTDKYFDENEKEEVKVNLIKILLDNGFHDDIDIISFMLSENYEEIISNKSYNHIVNFLSNEFEKIQIDSDYLCEELNSNQYGTINIEYSIEELKKISKNKLNTKNSYEVKIINKENYKEDIIIFNLFLEVADTENSYEFEGNEFILSYKYEKNSNQLKIKIQPLEDNAFVNNKFDIFLKQI